jgi:putative ABC transport system ATP-binding protein
MQSFNPAILFGDEPTGALNRSATKEVMDIINQINQEGTTVMLVTHDTKVAARADRVVFLVDGTICSEINLGKYKRNELVDKREEELSRWLAKQGF